MIQPDDYRWMAHALRLAERGLFTTDPNPRVGCVLVKEGRIVSEGWHRSAGGPHAEIEALKAAGTRARGADCYVTLEPCCHHGRTPPCTEALIKAGVKRVIAAMIDPNPQVAGKGLQKLQAAGIETASGILSREAEELNRGFCQRMRSGRPWVTSKLAASLDGRTALASGESRWITSESSRRDVHRLRARSSAIVTGIDTVLADNPALTARLEAEREVIQPVRVVVDSQLRMPLNARMLQLPGETWVATVSDDEKKRRALEQHSAKVLILPEHGDGRVNLPQLMNTLGDRQINEVWVEAGARLNGALLDQGLVDEWVIYLAPKLLGDSAKGLFHLPGMESMADGIDLSIIDIRAVGPDLRIRFIKAKS